MKSSNKIITFLILLCLLCLIATSQQTSQMPTDKQLNKQSPPSLQAIQFLGASESPPQIKVTQRQFSYLPEVVDDYSIVHTEIYPKSEDKGRFVASQAKDSFVTKLNQKAQKAIAQQTKKKQQQAEELLKKESIEQEKKIQEQKMIQQKPVDKLPIIEKTTEKKDETSTQQTKPVIPKQQNKRPQETLNPQVPATKKQDLFSHVQQKESPTIQKTDKTIKFKQHQFANPLEITNHPFELNDKIKQAKPQGSEDTKQKEEKLNVITENKQKQGEKPKNEEIKIDANKKNSQPKTQTKSQSKQQDKVPTIPKDNTQGKQNLQVQKPTKTEQQNLQQPSTPQTITPLSPAQLEIDQEYKRLSKALSMDPHQLTSHLNYQNMVQDQISDQNWKFLLAKLLIWVVIVISIYQAMCSSDERHNKAEKEKYAPVEMDGYQGRDTFEMEEREDEKH